MKIPHLPMHGQAGETKQETSAQFTALDLADLPASWLPALLPIGTDKRPLDPAIGSGNDWNHWPAFTTEALTLAPAIGLRLGPISSGTLALDFDGPEAETTFLELFDRPSAVLPPSLSWTSGKLHRRQIAFVVPEHRWAELEHRKAKVGALEFRWTGQQSVILGAHPETSCYYWIEGGAPRQVDLAFAPDWLLDLMPRKGAPPAPTLPMEAQPRVMGVAVPFRSFLSREAADLIDNGSTAGNCNGDGLSLSLELVAVETWLGQQGARPDETARDAYTAYLSNCPEAINGKPFDLRKAWQRFDGAGAKNPSPATPETKLLDRLRLHTRGSSPSCGGIGAPPWMPYMPPGGHVVGHPTNAAAPEHRGTAPAQIEPLENLYQWQSAKKQRRSVKRKLSRTKALACFERCVANESHRKRNSLTRRARLLLVVKALDLSAAINRQEISQRVLEAKDIQHGHHFEALTAADRLAMKRPTVKWCIPGLIPDCDLTIIGGRAKVGKTRLAVAIAAAKLKGTEVLGFPVTRETRPVILVTDDQADGDTADMLHALGLWDHPGLIWSRNFRLSESDINRLLVTITQNPGAVVILDSLRSISRSLEKGENDPEIGAILYDLKAAVIEAGSTPLLIHHANKGDGIGMEALSGHNAIAGAANTIITMHYVPGPDGKPVKDIPQRRLVREARSGDGFDLVISFAAGSGSFHRVGSFAEWQQQAQQGEQETNAVKSLAPTQREVLEKLKVAAEDTPGAWLTRRQVCEAVGVSWINRGRDPDGQRIQRALKRLVELGQIEPQRAGTETTYRMPSHETPETVMTAMPISDTNGSGVSTASDDSDDTSQQLIPLSSLSSPTRDSETPVPDSLSSLSSLSHPAWLPELLDLRDQFPSDHHASLALKIKGACVTGARVKEVLEKYG